MGRRSTAAVSRPVSAVAAELDAVRGPYQAEPLLPAARSWEELLAAWRAESGRTSDSLPQAARA